MLLPHSQPRNKHSPKLGCSSVSLFFSQSETSIFSRADEWQAVSSQDCEGLNKNGPHRFMCLNTCSPIGGTVWEELGVSPYWRRCCHWERALRIQETPFPVCSLCLLRVTQVVSSQLFGPPHFCLAIMDSSLLKSLAQKKRFLNVLGHNVLSQQLGK